MKAYLIKVPSTEPPMKGLSPRATLNTPPVIAESMGTYVRGGVRIKDLSVLLKFKLLRIIIRKNKDHMTCTTSSGDVVERVLFVSIL